MESLDREIRFKCYLSSPGRNNHRKLYNFFKTVKSIKQIAYGDHLRSKVLMKHHKRELFGFNVTNFKSKYVNNEED
jgi:hypothetical protein